MTRPWISYWQGFSYKPVLWAWKRSMCRLGVHLFDEVHSFGPGLMSPGLIAHTEAMTGLRAEPALTGDPEIDEYEQHYLVCDACELTVTTTEGGITE